MVNYFSRSSIQRWVPMSRENQEVLNNCLSAGHIFVLELLSSNVQPGLMNNTLLSICEAVTQGEMLKQDGFMTI